MVIVGRLGRPHGIKGWMKLYSYTDPLENIFNYPTWFIQPDHNSSNTISVEEWKAQDTSLLVKIIGCDTPEDAKLYTNREISIPREFLPEIPDDEYYWTDLEGLTVIRKPDQATLGIVDHLFETGANDVMVVKGDKEELIPFIKSVIIDVDLKAKTILVDWE